MTTLQKLIETNEIRINSDDLSVATMTVNIIITVKDAVIEQMSHESNLSREEVKTLITSGHKNAQKRFGEYLTLASKTFNETWSQK